MIGLGLGRGPRSWQRDPAVHPDTKDARAVKDHGELPALRAGLLARGYGQDDVSKVLSGNALRIFRAVWKA
jgi:microsomal dipeptidase-like Zn-dependent dipeptidase